MLPDNALSSIAIASDILGGRASTLGKIVDYESGPIAISNPSQGLQYQTWKGEVRTDGIYIGLPSSTLVKEIDLVGITEFSFTFDNNANLCITYVRYSRTYLWWYDTTLSAMTTTDFGLGYDSPKVSLDDKRQQANATNDIILGYIRSKSLYFRQQRDRFLTEYLLATNVGTRIERMGMGVNLRFQFHLIGS